jgi:DNA-binding CsgD family transcriptional regulator
MPADFPGALECMSDRFLFDAFAKKALTSMWSDLLDRSMAIASCVEDLDCSSGPGIVAFQFHVFLRPRFADEVFSANHPYASVQLLERWRKFNVPLLSRDEIAIACAEGGVDAFVLHHGIPADVKDDLVGVSIVEQAEAFLYYAISGFRFRSIMMECYGEADLRAKMSMGFRSLSGLGRQLAKHGISPRPDRYPYLVGVDRADVATMPDTILQSLFRYSPPILGLTPAQQELLQFALGGNTDAEIADLLEVSRPGVDSLWESIYAAISERMPGLVTDVPSSSAFVGRNEKRRLALRYIQHRREELRPLECRARHLVAV